MGTGFSYFTQKGTSSRIESDSGSTASSRDMAASSTRDKQQTNETWISSEKMRRYTKSFSDALEFLNMSQSIVDHQIQLEAELTKCHERLRRFTGDHARQSEINVENINSTNSPSALEQKYQQFYDHERMDAVDAIECFRLETKRDKNAELEEKLIACFIFEEAYEAAQMLRKNFLQGVSLILTSAPSIGAQYHEAKKKGNEVEFTFKPEGRQSHTLGQISENSLNVILKETAESCDVNALVERTLVGLRKCQENGSFGCYKKDFFLEQEIMKYIEKCCRYTWKLVCQNPPYHLETSYSLNKGANAFNPVNHQVCKDCKLRTSFGYINCVVWPGLFEGSSKRVIRKTEVIPH